VFAGPESDFFRNRLTHSLEVAQIAKSIAIRLNAEHPFFQQHHIDTTLVEIAALAHDLGHPPFGHNGEEALDNCMKEYGGFEGNAQTLRILSRLEKKQKLDETTNFGVSAEGEDNRIGLNLTFRTLASMLKYDHPIKDTRGPGEPLEKGYYLSEKGVVQKIKQAVLGQGRSQKPFKTIECSIMDLADDIAYSTYDMEDILKAGFVNPVQIVSSREDMLEAVAEKSKPKLGKDFSKEDVLRVLLSIFDDVFGAEVHREAAAGSAAQLIEYVVERWRICEKFISNGYMRTEFTSQLVGEFVRGVSAELDEDIPALSTARIDEEKLKKVEVLKHFTYQNMIMSPRMKVAEYRGKEIVIEIFKAFLRRRATCCCQMIFAKSTGI
jgi:dGTPase